MAPTHVVNKLTGRKVKIDGAIGKVIEANKMKPITALVCTPNNVAKGNKSCYLNYASARRVPTVKPTGKVIRANSTNKNVVVNEAYLTKNLKASERTIKKILKDGAIRAEFSPQLALSSWSTQGSTSSSTMGSPARSMSSSTSKSSSRSSSSKSASRSSSSKKPTKAQVQALTGLAGLKEAKAIADKMSVKYTAKTKLANLKSRIASKL